MDLKARSTVPGAGFGPIQWPSTLAPTRGPGRTLTAAVTALAIVALFHSFYPHARTLAVPHPDPDPETPFRWSDIPPSRTLTWHPCYNTQLDCARLDLPMDWLAADEDADSDSTSPDDDGGASNDRVILAVARLRATNPTPRHGGGNGSRTLFFNPGGPGGSGIWALRDHGRDLQAIIGDDYDIVSFDPRGVGASLPRVECWTSARERLLWEMGDVGVVDAHDGVVYDAYARAVALSGVCERTMGREGKGVLLKHLGTASHARDLREVMRLMGEERLRYWGFSYGTVLGGTFAAMYPRLVERMVNDGNVDYREWYSGGYVNFLHDADKVVEAFYASCYEVGPLRCAFWADSPEGIRRRLDALLAKIRVSPVPVPSSEDGEETLPELVTYSKVKRMLSTALYQPLHRFHHIATVLAALDHGDAGPYQTYTSLDRPSRPPFCPISEPTSPPVPEDTPDAFPSILCSDAHPFTLTPQQFSSYASSLITLSPTSGAVHSTTYLSCAGRTIRPAFHPPSLTSPIHTHFPLLFINNLADNITPLISARNNSALFPRSVVLVQNSFGHTSLAAPSSCTARWVRRYFREGRLPEEGAVCEGDGGPFGEEVFGRAFSLSSKVGGEDGEIKGDGQGNDGGEGDELTRAVGRLARDGRWGLKFGAAWYG